MAGRESGPTGDRPLDRRADSEKSQIVFILTGRGNAGFGESVNTLFNGEKIEWWMMDYNEERPHTATNRVPPTVYRMQIEQQLNPENSTLELCP